MKIGILTLPLHTNYGGILQAYALQTVLERMGHDVEVIDKRWKPIPWNCVHKCLFFAKKCIKSLLRRNTYLDYRHPSVYSIVSQNTQTFIDKHIHKHFYPQWSDIDENQYDAIVVGGDQIWRPQYIPFLMDSTTSDVYLKFAKNWSIKRISYAPSFGSSIWEYDEHSTQECGSLLNLFDAVSVRERNAVGLIQTNFNQKACQVLDPTLLLSREDYEELCKDAPNSKGQLLIYILDRDNSIEQLILSVSKTLNKIPYTVNSKVEDATAPLKERIQPSVEQWLKGFMDAEAVITDSFHACIFAMIFNKPFIVIGNKKRGIGRLESLLSEFGQEKRLILDSNNKFDISVLKLVPNVNLSQMKETSLEFLKKGLA